jgi:hypothetical protein
VSPRQRRRVRRTGGARQRLGDDGRRLGHALPVDERVGDGELGEQREPGFAAGVPQRSLLPVAGDGVIGVVAEHGEVGGDLHRQGGGE